MTYESIEISNYDSEPKELYTFQSGSETWRYIDSSEDFSFNGNLYKAENIKRKRIKQTQEISKMPQLITTSADLDFVTPYKQTPQEDVATLLIERTHLGDSESVIIWKGRVTNVKFVKNVTQCKIRCESLYSALFRNTLSRFYQVACPHVLYEPKCGVDKSLFLTIGTISSSSGIIITAPEFGAHPDGYFSGGFVLWIDGSGSIHKRFIKSHTGNDLTLTLPMYDLPDGDSVSAHPGCDHSIATCTSKFVNTVRYGGQPFYADKNPFGISPIF